MVNPNIEIGGRGGKPLPNLTTEHCVQFVSPNIVFLP